MNYDPEKFSMEVAKGVKAYASPDAPDVVVPFCKAHRSWPCRHCGTSHFEGCDCPVCVEPEADPLARTKEAASYAASMILGMERHWRKFDAKVADELLEYSSLLRKFAQS